MVNVVLAGEGWAPPDGLTIGPDGGNIGDMWDGSRYTGRIQPPEVLVTSDDIRAEAHRRIHALLGATG